jgi:protein-tyrosine phosphatase
MTPVILDPASSDDERDAVHRAVQTLVEGKLVAFPTETVYGIAADGCNASAVRRLLDAKGRQAGNPLTLAVKSIDEVLDYCPDMPVVARRIGRRGWPGPVTLVLEAKHPDGLVQRLPDEVRAAVSPSGFVGFRVPDHRFILAALRLLPGPLALTSANRSGQPDAVNAEEVVQALGSDIDLVLSDGPSKYGHPSSVVRVVGNRLEMLRQGVVSESVLRRFASFMVLIVCTGNTCRSPMAQVLLQARIAARLGCTAGELEERGIMILSAGVSAGEGGPASPEAVQAMQQRGLDLTHHESRTVNDVLVRFADLVLTMTQGHRDALLAHWPEAAQKTALLGRDAGDVSDPVGGALQDYVECASQIDSHLERWSEQFDLSAIPSFEKA